MIVVMMSLFKKNNEIKKRDRICFLLLTGRQEPYLPLHRILRPVGDSWDETWNLIFEGILSDLRLEQHMRMQGL